jgi:MFS family permease
VHKNDHKRYQNIDSNSISIAIFLPNLEVSIVSTALITITNDLKGFSQAGWVIVAYLITYTGMSMFRIALYPKLTITFVKDSLLFGQSSATYLHENGPFLPLWLSSLSVQRYAVPVRT